ncbi:hypothetical protein CYMTET_10938 [Cymbomonas tetramitiformis]|uniref:Cilia- and flagella-associated protein 36 n=1 Tax=Cymbomonas tetramitiformis TaxID=36881 RepID=A0AAE0LDY7_9CHLO|nr:hypothetical protein CYMTET_10938 [Cymbomonas tetramitiformis]
MAGDDMEWLHEAIIRFLQGPCYSTPLMGFIDENCAIFDGEEENKLEYTDVHHNFKDVVDSLLSDFLEDLGVTPEKFVEVVAGCVHTELNSFVLTSILTVDDFQQFKAMMVKRNIDLTNEVLEAHAAKAAEPEPEPATTPEEEQVDAELAEVLRLSKEMFELEKARSADPTPAGGDAEIDADMAKVLKESMADQRAMQLDQERAEIEQAIQLSLQLEQEQDRLIQEEKKPELAEAAPVPAPAPAPAPIPAAAPAPTPTPSPAPKAATDIFAKREPLPPVVKKVCNDAGSAAGMTTATAAASAEDRLAVREAAKKAASDQREMLVAKKHKVDKAKEAVPPTKEDAEAQRIKEYMSKQRDALIAKKKAQREKELQTYQSDWDKYKTEQLAKARGDEPAKPTVSPEAAEADAKRAQLRNDLARKLKQELMHKSLSRLDK